MSNGGYGLPARVDISGLSVAGLSAGKHTFNIRAQDSEGFWGPLRLISFNVIVPNYTLTDAEFFIDSDPGAGNGIPLTPSDNLWDKGSELVSASLALGALSPGLHNVCVRGRDSRNIWGSVPLIPQYPMCQAFIITPPVNKAVVKGIVTEQRTGMPLNGVRIYSDEGTTTYSTFDGSYSMVVTEGTRHLIISTGGYQPIDDTLTAVAPITGHNFILVKLEQPFGNQRNIGYIAEPVNTATGNYYFNRTDLKANTPGIPFNFERYYNAQDLSSSPLGFGWTNNMEVRIYKWEDMVIAKYGDGHEESYKDDGAGNFLPQPGVFTKLSFSNGTYKLLTKDQLQYLFNTSNLLIGMVDRNGNRLDINRETSGKITTVIDSAGRNYTFDYDNSGYLSSITDPLGRIVKYDVNNLGNLVLVADASGNETTYTYDSHHLLLTIKDPRNNDIVSNTYDYDRRIISYQKDALGNTTTFNYDSLARITTIVDPLFGETKHAYDIHLNLIKDTDPLGNYISYVYDNNYNRISITDKNGNQTSYTYDVNGNVLTKTNMLGYVSTLTYDSINNPLTRTDALGKTTSFEYDANGNLIKSIDPLGFSTLFTYNTAGLPLTITDAKGNTITNTYDLQGNLTEVTDSLGNKIQYTYDSVGRRLSVIDPRLKETVYTYDDNDNLLTVSDALGNVTRHTYDVNNNKETITDPLGNVTKYVYDVKDRLIKIIDPLNNAITNTYDALDRKISVLDKNGNSTLFTYDKVGNLTQEIDALNNKKLYTYDPNGNKLTAVDPLGKTIQYTYDGLNRLLSTSVSAIGTTSTSYDGLDRIISTANPNGQITTFNYDDLGHLVKVTDSNGGVVIYTYDSVGNRLTSTEPNGNITTYSYDSMNRVIQKKEPLQGVYQYRYDPTGNLIQRTDPKGVIANYTYDGNNRLLSTNNQGLQVSYNYDANGNRISMTDSLGTSTYSYDSLNRMVSYTDSNGKTIGYGYDRNGNRTSISYPDAKAVSYSYNGINKLVLVRDWLGGTASYNYDASGDIIKLTNPNGTTTSYTYDQARRITSLSNAASDNSIISKYSFTLDNMGNTKQSDQIDSLVPIHTNQNISYVYDNENRLISIGGVAVAYDANGNMTQTGTDNYIYDPENRLIQSSINGISRQYSYDGSGNRLNVTQNGISNRFVLDINNRLPQVLAETDGNGNITAYYVYGLGLISKIFPAGSSYYYHFDSRGSTVALTNGAGVITDRYSYGPFGNLTDSEGETNNSFKFLGRYGVMDDGDGLLHIRARYYMPEIGRFITKDLLTGKDGDGQSLNRYVYALNNPVRLVDVTGFYSEITALKGVSQMLMAITEIAQAGLSAFGIDPIASLEHINSASKWFNAGIVNATINALFEKPAVSHDKMEGLYDGLLEKTPEWLSHVSTGIGVVASIHGLLSNAHSLASGSGIIREEIFLTVYDLLDYSAEMNNSYGLNPYGVKHLNKK